ncbi:T9SS type A sorting domain-containing protein [Hymenobacter edaphi]|uniref:Secretion system C-terminal sorting domain-containing protein n=1 Tax=Hymenobacter edaphi TaxID=2211146 RepID=A0A328BJG7_9BACT|nr:T9SS type A sorting domain-containing protein [Hymenobacter edaphi]RAK66064.1 hypothetical protein DLM85_15290 [Hymenobacter edaphi]
MKARLLLAALLAGSLSATAQQGWQAITDLPGGARLSYQRLYVPSATSVWMLRPLYPVRAASSVEVVYSPDNGQTWQVTEVSQQAPNGPNTTYPNVGTECVDLFVLNDQNAWLVVRDVVTGTRVLKRSTTGPAGFQPVTTPIPAGLASVTFFDASTGLATGTVAQQVVMQRTTDGGATWAPVSLPAAMAGVGYLLSKQVVLGSNVWFATDQGGVLHSADAGATWALTNTGLGVGSNLVFRDALHGLAYAQTGSGGTSARLLAATNDGGLTWVRRTPTGPVLTSEMTAVPGTSMYLSGGTDFASPANLGLAYSTDEGQTWQRTGPDLPFSRLAATSPTRVWGCLTYNSTPYPPRTDHQVYQLTGTLLRARPAQVAPGQGVYPNPTAGTVQLPAGHSYREARLYDPAGRLCRTLRLAPGSAQLELGTLPDGLYQLQLRTAAGVTAVQRLAVQR